METIAHLLERRAQETPESPFLTVANETVPFGEFADRTRRLAAGLRELGVRRGDKICIFLPNGMPFALAMFATARLGAIFVPAHAQFRAGELRYVVQHSDAVAVFTDPERQGFVEEVRAGCPLLRHSIVTDELLDELLRTAPSSDEPDVRPDDAAGILYTSGTTGRPKGVLLRQSAYAMNARALVERMEITHNDTMYCVLPLAHLNAQRSSLLPAVVAGARLILAERFSATAFWPTVRSERVTFFSVLPSILSILLQQQPSAEDRSHGARVCLSPATTALIDAFEERFGIPVINSYGLTEGMLNVMNFLDARRKRDAIGQPLLPEVHRLRIVDVEDNDVPLGTTGEIVLQSPAVMMEYYKDPETTRQTLRGGWLHTGDLGYLDDRRFLHFVGRRKELIRRGGENVAPAEIESTLAEHPAVLEAAAVAVPDPILEEEIKVCVIVRPGYDGGSALAAELFDYCAARLASFKIPRYLEYRSEFPRTPTLRVERHKLANVAAQEGSSIFDRYAFKP